MMQADFDKLINKDKYQVFVFMSHASLPVLFSVHPWIVINEKGKISRLEIKRDRNKNEELGYLYINDQLPYEGLPIIYPFKKFPWKAQVLGLIEGDENSLAKRMTDFIGNSKKTYPYLKKYSLITGPNCGTYVEWVLDNFPEIEIKLPWSAIGKNYKK